MTDKDRHDLMTAYLRRKRCGGEGTTVSNSEDSAATQISHPDLALENGELVVVRSKNSPETDLVITTRRLLSVNRAQMNIVRLECIQEVRPRFDAAPGKMSSIDLAIKDGRSVEVKTEPGSSFDAILGLLFMALDRGAAD